MPWSHKPGTWVFDTEFHSFRHSKLSETGFLGPLFSSLLFLWGLSLDIRNCWGHPRRKSDCRNRGFKKIPNILTFVIKPANQTLWCYPLPHLCSCPQHGELWEPMGMCVIWVGFPGKHHIVRISSQSGISVSVYGDNQNTSKVSHEFYSGNKEGKKTTLVSHVGVSTCHPTGSQKSSVHWDGNIVRKGCRQPVRDYKNITLFNCPCSCCMQALLKLSSQIWGLLKYCIYLKGWLPRDVALQMPLLSAAAKAFPVL